MSGAMGVSAGRFRGRDHRAWRMTRRIARTAAIAVVVAAAVPLLAVLLPAIVTAAAFSHHRDVRRMTAVASRWRCRSCGTVLGAEAVRRADAAWARHLGERLPLGRLRMVRLVHAICPGCGARYRWLRRERAFAAE